MKLSMSVLYDELRVYAHSAIHQHSDNFSVASCRIFNSAAKSFSPQHAYICTQSDLILVKESLKNEPLNFICIGELNLKDVSWSVIFLKKSSQIDEVFDFLQDVFDRYNEWEGALSSAISAPDGYQAILNVAMQKLWNPIGLTNLAMYTIASAGHFMDKSRQWRSVSNSGFAALEDTTDQETATTTYLLKANRKPFFVPNTHYGTQNVMAPIYSGDNICGILKTNDVNQPITEGQMFLLHHVQIWIERIAAIKPIPVPYNNDSFAFVERIIDGQNVDPDTIACALAEKRWREDNDFILLLCRLKSGADIGSHRAPNYLARLKNILPDSIIVLKEPYLVFLFNSSFIDDHPLEEVELFLEKLNLYGAMSLPFGGFMNLREAFKQATAMLELYPTHENTTIFRIGDYYSEFLVRIIEQHASLRNLCHPQLLKYAGVGEKELQHICSLCTYLSNGKNAAETASSLYIHRNTLRNHLAHIRDYTGIDAEHISEKNFLPVYFSCLIIQYLYKGKRTE